jgi:hypothetical protein
MIRYTRICRIAAGTGTWRQSPRLGHVTVIGGTIPSGFQHGVLSVLVDLRTFSEGELQRWLYLRAIEWSVWPAFVSQPIVPVLLIFFPAIWVLVGLLITDFLWRFIRYSFVSPSLANDGAFFVVILKWPSAIGSAIYLLVHQRYGMAVLALLWPLLAGFVSAPGSLLVAVGAGRPTLVGQIELELAKRIGHVSRDTTPVGTDSSTVVAEDRQE